MRNRIIYHLKAFDPKDIFQSEIDVYGDLDSIWLLWYNLKNKYIIQIWNCENIRINPNKSPTGYEMNNDEEKIYDLDMYKNFNCDSEILN
jgi:hypothetical protein